MKKCYVVKKKSDFDRIINNGEYVKNNEFVVYYLDNNSDVNHFGISVGKKIGNAVMRNYYKRIVRNICDKCKNLYSNGKDYIIIVRKGCIRANYVSIEKSLIHLISKVKEKEKQNEKTE